VSGFGIHQQVAPKKVLTAGKDIKAQQFTVDLGLGKKQVALGAFF
jgi:hypothetical protein